MKRNDGEVNIKMELSESYKELIEGWLLYCEDPEDLLYWASAPDLLDRRERIHQAGLDEDDTVKKADIELIKVVLKEGANPSDLFGDPEKYPLSHWWWHLDKIADKTFPAELLPAHLREIYLKASESDS